MGFNISLNIGGNEKLQKFKNLFSWAKTSPKYNKYSGDANKIQMIFSNPAVLKVFSLQCDLFSLAKLETKNKELTRLVNNPNPFQTQKQFLWDYIFWLMLGNAIIYIKSNVLSTKNNKMYFLDPSRLVFTDKLQKKLDRIYLSDKSIKELLDQKVEYTNKNGKSNYFKLKELIFISDLTNSTGNWFKGNSRLDALYKILTNSEVGIDSKNINIRYLGKYMISGGNDEDKIQDFMMEDEEKEDIETKMNGSKSVHATTTPIDIKRFIDNSDVVENLDKSYWNDYYKIGKIFNIPKDVLEANLSKGSTYENQEKAKGAHISYTLEPKGGDLTNRLDRHFNIEGTKLSWTHLPFMQVFEKERADKLKALSKSLEVLIKAGATFESACLLLNIELEKNRK